MAMNLNYGGPPQGDTLTGEGLDHIYRLVLDLTNPDTRDEAMHELSKRREDVPELAPILWYSFGTTAALLQEIVSVYPLLSPPKLKPAQSTRVCNALALLQCVASHRDTRTLFLNGMESF
jgi:CCR4-NOT transcription complex subunit 9